MARFDLTDFEWSVIAPLLPNKPRGVPRVDDRRVALDDSSTVWIARHSILIWIGIALNLLLIVPLFFFPERMLAFFNLPPLAQPIWARACGMLLAIIFVFHVPTTIDFARYRTRGVSVTYFWGDIFCRGGVCVQSAAGISGCHPH